jgi:predicted nucleic-acid-binding Zn-ribbon protein
MRSGKCPKCDSREVYIRNPNWYVKNAIVIDREKVAPCVVYICVECGYTESYLSERSDLRQVRQELPSVDDMKRKNDQSRAKKNEEQDDDYFFEE